MRLGWRGIFAMVCASFVLGQAAIAQQGRADGRMGYERLVAVVPMVGSGTYEDPRRPAYVPDYLLRTLESLQLGKSEEEASPIAAALAKGKAPAAIVGFHYEISDDGNFALAEFFATDRAAFKPLLEAAKRPFASAEIAPNRNALEGGFDLKAFEAGKARRLDIETEFRKHKRDFSLDRFAGRKAVAATGTE